ncbi:NUDIX hydrolase [Bacillus sp. 31A1R]|uniref:NUDIX hydrolase n=1 Tax=Robertmurraya mangrovi TaxID=3098077 RepID=A0ABU5IWI6_9BACI|nr:NUDIX hydrolase [Bacillus sp. 31A1R]MDZ5471490.1 NUDIX hydrolase [Bacillus sp. 31A1R]
MANAIKYHRAFGVYGLLFKNDKLLVINKNRGPYINRYDLPGGKLEETESLTSALEREFLEETGFQIEVLDNIGVIDFMFPCNWQEFTHVHHIAVFYLVNDIGGSLSNPETFEGQDSLGALWISEEEATEEHSSPLVIKAFEWFKTGKLGLHVKIFDEWEMKD